MRGIKSKKLICNKISSMVQTILEREAWNDLVGRSKSCIRRSSEYSLAKDFEITSDQHLKRSETFRINNRSYLSAVTKADRIIRSYPQRRRRNPIESIPLREYTRLVPSQTAPRNAKAKQRKRVQAETEKPSARKTKRNAESKATGD